MGFYSTKEKQNYLIKCCDSDPVKCNWQKYKKYLSEAIKNKTVKKIPLDYFTYKEKSAVDN